MTSTLTPIQAEFAKRETQAWVSRTMAISFANSRRLLLPKGDWRWVGNSLASGFIHGLDRSQGKVTISNGILVVLERPDGSLFFGHVENLESVKTEDDSSPSSRASEGKRRGRKTFVEYE